MTELAENCDWIDGWEHVGINLKFRELNTNWKLGKQSDIKSKVDNFIGHYPQLFLVLWSLLNSGGALQSPFNVFIAWIAYELRYLHPSCIQYFIFNTSYLRRFESSCNPLVSKQQGLIGSSGPWHFALKIYGYFLHRHVE